MKQIILIAFLLISTAAYATDPVIYYMDAVSGNDNNAGTSPETAWETFAKVNRTALNPDDHVLLRRGQRFGSNQRDTCLVVSSSGTAGHPIVYGAWGTGDMPVDDASRQITGWESQGGNIYKRTKTVTDSTYAIWFGGVLGTRVMTVDALDVNREWIHWPDSTKVYLTTAADTASVWKSKTNAISSTSKNYITIQNLKITHGASNNNTALSVNIKINTSTNVTITCCVIDSSYGYAIITSGIFSNIRSNIFYANNRNTNAQADSGYFYNNTVIGGTEGFTQSNVKNWAVKNNIFYSQTSEFIKFSQATPYLASNNIFYATSYTNKWVRKTTYFSTLASWQDSTGQEANSLTGDPLFVNAAAGDYRLTSNSPAINRGANLGLLQDLTGRSIIGTPDIGAYETIPEINSWLNSFYYEKKRSW